MTAMCSSIVMDFYMKTVGASNLQSSRMDSFPLVVEEKYRKALHGRTLRLNWRNEPLRGPMVGSMGCLLQT